MGKKQDQIIIGAESTWIVAGNKTSELIRSFRATDNCQVDGCFCRVSSSHVGELERSEVVMGGSRWRIPMGPRVLMGFSDSVRLADESASLRDIAFGFFETGDDSPDSSSSFEEIGWDADGEMYEQCCAESKAFWEEQYQLLHAALSRSSNVESRIRQAIRGALRESQLAGAICTCQKPVVNDVCHICLRRDISDRLRNMGYNSAICKSKWKRTSSEFPSGEHTCIDVLDNSKKGEVRVVIDLNFRVEFEMARASEEYNRLVNGLPEVFVGKADKLRNVIKILCSAAKRCMKENKMHMGPWRKQKYMQAKWFGTYERTMCAAPQFEALTNKLQRSAKSSMLTFDLLENVSSLHCTAVAV